MEKKNYLITGISGMLGRLIALRIKKMPEYQNGEIRIIGIGLDKLRAQERLGKDFCNEIVLLEKNLLDIESLCNCFQEIRIDYVIHCAAITDSKQMVSNPVEVADGIVLGTRNMLELARKCNVKSMVYLSSMEVYGTVSDIGRPRTEEELGDIDLKSPRSCYPMAKRMAEHYCHIYHREYGVPVKIARLAQTFGTGVRQDDNRVYMQFARAASEGRDIILKTSGNSMGNYCATEDAINAIFTIMERGESGEVYNVVSEENTMCIREMANMVASRIANGEIDVKIECEDNALTGYAPDTGLRLSSEKLRGLGWKPTKSMQDMYRDVLAEIGR